MALKCIAGLIRPDEGRVELDGRILYDSASGIDLAPQKRSVGYLFQQYALFPNMTVRENILAGTKKLPHEARSSFAEEMIERFHLKGLENHYPAQLSGGQQQRTALARITVSRPGAILLDESFSALDSYLKLQMEEELHTFLEEYPGEVILNCSHRKAKPKLQKFVEKFCGDVRPDTAAMAATASRNWHAEYCYLPESMYNNLYR